MRIFGRSKSPKASASRRTSSASQAAVAVAVPVMPEPAESVALTDLAQTDEMPILRDFAPPSYPALTALPGGAPDVVESVTGVIPGEDGDSDVFVCRRSTPGEHEDAQDEAAAAAAAAAVVTLFVYGWESVEPGCLSWAFPSLRAALEAVRTMRNAIEWCIVAGHEWSSIDAARESGAVLIEQNV